MKHQQQNDHRRRELAKIHIAKKDLGMDRETYEAMLFSVARVRSSADLDHAGRAAVLDHLQGLGWEPKRGKKKRYPNRPHSTGVNPQLQKIEALLAEAKRPWAYATVMAKRMYQIERLDFCESEQLSGIITALMRDARRHGRRTE